MERVILWSGRFWMRVRPYVDCTYTLHSKPEQLLYTVDFVSTDDMRFAGIPEIYAYIILIVEKDQVVDVWLGNG